MHDRLQVSDTSSVDLRQSLCKVSMVVCVLLALSLTVAIPETAYGVKARNSRALPGAVDARAEDLTNSIDKVVDPPFKASQHIGEVLGYVHSFSDERNLEALDFYAGDSAFARRSRHMGLRSETFDILHSAEENVLTRTGYFLGLRLCCGLQMLLGSASFVWYHFGPIRTHLICLSSA
jgi:hypothetical protein